MKSKLSGEKIREMRESGATYRQIGEAAGISTSWARDLYLSARRKHIWREPERKNPSLIPWHRGLNHKTVDRLEELGFDTKKKCLALASDDLWWWRGHRKQRFPAVMLNEVRAWLGVKPYEKPKRIYSDPEIQRAKRILEAAGWQVFPPTTFL